MTSTARVIRSAVGLLAIGFAALMLIVLMTLRLGDRARSTFDEVIAARDTRSAASEARAAIQTAESSQRGYVLTGNQIYLAPYGTAKVSAQLELERAKRLLADDLDIQPALRRLTELVFEKIDEMDRAIALKRDRRDGEALAVIRTNRGKALMDEANVFFSGVIRAADERIAKSVDEQRENAAMLRWTTIAAGVLIVAVVAIVVLTVLRYTREIAAAREEVTALNLGLEQRVAERTGELARANHEIQRFAHVVSHDLRAPLVSIVGFAGEIEGGLRRVQPVIGGLDGTVDGEALAEARLAVDEDMPEAIGFIRSSARKMEGLIGGILTLSREGRRILHPEPVLLAELVRTSADAIRHQLSVAGGTLTLDIDVPGILADRLSLDQIVTNLLDNAVKYRSPKRPLAITVRGRVGEDGRLAIEVADNGRGIAERDHEAVFDLFRRAGPQDQPGEGMGLAHVRAIVRHLGGEVSLTSQLDAGTTFRVVLPVRLAEEALVA